MFGLVSGWKQIGESNEEFGSVRNIQLGGAQRECSFRKINEAKELLLDITADGVITEDEKPDLEKIINTLNEVNEVTQNLKNWIEKSLK